MKFTEQYLIPDALSNLNSLSIESIQTTSTKQFRKSISSILKIPNHLFNYISYDIYRRNSVNSQLHSCNLHEDAYNFFFSCKQNIQMLYMNLWIEY